MFGCNLVYISNENEIFKNSVGRALTLLTDTQVHHRDMLGFMNVCLKSNAVYFNGFY